MTEQWLEGIARKPMARYHGGWMTPLFAVVHHTGGRHPWDLKVLMGQTRRVVSCHYYISRAGHLHQLLPCNVVGYHAGRSRWTHRGKLYRGLNRYSIGIELENLDGNLYPYTREQVDALCRVLVPRLVAAVPLLGQTDRWLGHEHVAPRRKIDPGALFPWGRLEEAVLNAASHGSGGGAPAAVGRRDGGVAPTPQR